MPREPLASNTVISAAYDSAKQELELEFKHGRVYRYSGVPAGVYEFLKRASSKGGFVNRMIEGKYPYQEVTEQAPPQDLLQALRASLEERERSE